MILRAVVHLSWNWDDSDDSDDSTNYFRLVVIVFDNNAEKFPVTLRSLRLRHIENIPPWAKESGCPERYESDNSLIRNLGLHDVSRSMLSPILSDYDRINSVYQTHRSDQQMVENHRMLIVRGRLH